MKILLLLSTLTIFYIYVGYPVLIFLLSRFRGKKVHRDIFTPLVTIVIAAYNEETHIAETILNKIDLHYPKDKTEIIVVSDGSTDRTDEIVKEFGDRGVLLLRQEPRRGKTAALNLAAGHATGEILIFSDANSIYDPDALHYLLMNFKDPRVGYATGKMIYTEDSGNPVGDGCSAYMKYENYLRTLETRFNSVVGVDGGIDAVRKSLYEPMRPDQLPDLILPLKVVEKGYRVIYEPQAILREPSLASSGDEYRMRVRVSLRALWALKDMGHLLNIFKYHSFAWELFSHKIIRYLAFVFLIIIYISNFALWTEGPYYRALFLAQNGFYASLPISYFIEKTGHRSGILYIPYYFTLVNLASAHAFLKFVLGHQQTVWNPRKGA